MPEINSVLGPIDTNKLGFTLMHEHLMVGFHGILSEYPEFIVNNPLERIIARLKEAKAGGIDTIVDMTTTDLGRDINLMAEASRYSGVNIIACAGWWLEVPHILKGITPNQMAKAFVREIEEGIAGTKIKVGVLKSASDLEGVTPSQEVVLRAVARAHKVTGVPIALHSYAQGQVAKQQLRILKEEGVDLRRVKVDHSNDTTDEEYLLWILEQGCFLGLDHYPGWMVSPMARTKTMKALIDAGYAERLCPSHDCSSAHVLPQGETLEQRESNNPLRYLYIRKVVFPWLREMGVAESIISRLCIDGPRNFFEGK
jgi:phosphotriesterase-related protein